MHQTGVRINVPRSLCSPVLCSPVSMFPSPMFLSIYVPHYLCSPVSMFPSPMFLSINASPKLIKGRKLSRENNWVWYCQTNNNSKTTGHRADLCITNRPSFSQASQTNATFVSCTVFEISALFILRLSEHV